MKYCLHCLCLVLFLNLLFCNDSVKAETLQIPQWYKMTADFEEVPALGKPVTLNVRLSAIIGNLEDVSVKLLLPEGWSVDKNNQKLRSVLAGNTEVISFSVTPKSYLAQGSVIVESVFTTPKADICAVIDKMIADKDTAKGMISSVEAWPESSKRYTDVSFAIFPEESFYPVTGDMWIAYADEMAPNKDFKGPVYYSNSVISIHQAQTDVEMYGKLSELLKSDETLVSRLSESGIDLNKKKSDYLMGLYVLAEDAWRNNDYQTALDLLEQLGANLKDSKALWDNSLKIASGNLKALVFWKQGHNRLAEEAFRNTFASNRKHKLQRYVLRNIGLLMYAMRDKATAQQMYRLAGDMKKGYSLIEKELPLLK